MTGNYPGRRLRELLASGGLSQSEIAEAVRTTGATISRIIGGKSGLTVGMAERIAAVTGVRAGWLLTGEIPMYPNQDLGNITREAYLAGWRDAVSAMRNRMDEIATGAPSGKAESTRRGSVSALDAAKRHRRELEERGLVHPPAAPAARRRKRA